MESVSPTSLEYLLLGSVRESLPTPPLVYQYLEVKYSTQLLQRNAWPMGDAQSLLSEKNVLPFKINPRIPDLGVTVLIRQEGWNSQTRSHGQRSYLMFNFFFLC